jgi:hypothetical protein
MRPPPVLFHYTCQHGHRALLSARTVRPAVQIAPLQVAGTPLAHLSWFTDLSPPDPWALGLTNVHITCDRTRYRWRVDPTERPPIGWGRLRNTLPRTILDGLEAEPRAEPAHWWVATWPVRVTFDPITDRTDT